jgi:hypothetical protein
MWQAILIWVATTVIGWLLTPKPPKPDTPQPGNIEAPVASEGQPIPVLFGTRVIRQPNCVWYGDVMTTEIRKSSGGGKK